MPAEQFEKLTTASFSEYTSDKDCIVIFHKKNCPHCKIMHMVLEKVVVKTPLNVATVDSEEEPELMQQVGVERVPTLCVLRKGAVRGKFVGVMNPNDTIKWYNKSR